MTDHESIQEVEGTAKEIARLIEGMECAAGLLAVLIVFHAMLHELMDGNPSPDARAQFDRMHTLVVEWMDARYREAKQAEQVEPKGWVH